MIVIVGLVVLLVAVIVGFTGVDQFKGNTKRLPDTDPPARLTLTATTGLRSTLLARAN